MPLHTPNMVNMMMQTQPASESHVHSQQQQLLGTTADLAQDTQQLGESLLTWHSRHICHPALYSATWLFPEKP